MKEFRVIHISADSPLERGVQYGRQAAEEIKVCINEYKERFRTGRGMTWECAQELAMVHLPCIQELMPDMLEEAQGIAQGAQEEFADILVLNCRYEILHYPQQKECTAFALQREATRDGHIYVGQNWDQRPSLLGHSLILDITEEERNNRIIGVTEAGQLIRNGVNSLGVAQCSNSLHSSLDGTGCGIPSNFVRRKLLTMSNIKDMVDLIRTAKRCVSVNYCIGSRENIVTDIEAVPGQPVRLEPVESIIAHANNLVVNRDQDTYKDEAFRGERLQALLEERRGDITLEYIQECLKDHYGYPEGICSHISEENKTWQTIASIIYDLDGQKAWICYGNPCEGEYKEYCL